MVLLAAATDWLHEKKDRIHKVCEKVGEVLANDQRRDDPDQSHERAAMLLSQFPSLHNEGWNEENEQRAGRARISLDLNNKNKSIFLYSRIKCICT